jgi:tripartite-type tricarboxylate transporter receptor subunit TctC
MTLSRRRLLHVAAGATAAPALSRIAWAQAYPTRPVRIVVGVPAGGTFDLVARLIGQWLSERLGQQFVIENRPGAATNVGTDMVAHAAADGYTLLLAGSPGAINETLYDKSKLNFDFVRDIAPVASIERMPLVMAVNPALPVKTVPEFISYAKANPARINQGSGGIGSTGHVSGELFKMLAGVPMAHVPYRGEAPALTDLLGGQVQVVFSTLARRFPTSKRARCARWRSPPRSGWTPYPTCRRSRISCQATRRARGAASARPATRRTRSSPSSTRRSTPASPTPS